MILLRWQANDPNTFQGFPYLGYDHAEIYRSLSAGMANPEHIADVQSTQYTDLSVVAGTQYFYQLRPIDKSGNAYGFSIIVFATAAAAGDTAPWTPYTPIVNSSNGITMTYTASARFKKNGKTIFYAGKIAMINKSVASGPMLVSLPFLQQGTATFTPGVAVRDLGGGAYRGDLIAEVTSDGTDNMLKIMKTGLPPYQFPLANGETCLFNVDYESAN